MAFAIIFLAFHTRETTAKQDMSFAAFLQLFPKKNLPFDISLKQMVKIIKNKPEIYQDSAETQNINSIFKKYLPNSVQGNETSKDEYAVANRGFFVNSPVAQIRLKEHYLIFYSRSFMAHSSNCQYYLTVLDKNGQHLLTETFASHGYNGYFEAYLDKNLNIFKNRYVRNEKRDLIFESKMQTNLFVLIGNLRQPKVDIHALDTNVIH